MISFPPDLASQICPYMGFYSNSFSLVGSDSLETSENLVHPRETDSLTVSVDTSDIDSCQFVNMSCGAERCGQRPLYRNLPPSKTPAETAPGSWPWQATFLVEGEVKCGGAVVDASFVMTVLDCAEILVAEGTNRFITVLVGQDRKTEVRSQDRYQERSQDGADRKRSSEVPKESGDLKDKLKSYLNRARAKSRDRDVRN